MSKLPLEYSHLVGFNEDLERLKTLFLKGKLPPVLLFHGRDSIGKSLFVSKLCAYLVCEEKKACGKCGNCLSLKQNKNPSVLFLNNEDKLISVEEALQVKSHLLTASGARDTPRIIFIRDVERLSEQSTNKLLTSFEDLPPFSYVFLTTGSRYSLMQTLLSRCVPYFLKPPSLDESFSCAKKYLLSEGKKSELSSPEEEKIKALIKLTRGAIGQVLSLLSEDSGSRRDLTKIFYDQIHERNYNVLYELIETLKKDKTLSLEEILTAKEVAINQAYKSRLSENDNSLNLKHLEEKRALLKMFRSCVLDKKIKLNKGLILESLLV